MHQDIFGFVLKILLHMCRTVEQLKCVRGVCMRLTEHYPYALQHYELKVSVNSVGLYKDFASHEDYQGCIQRHCRLFLS